MASLEISHENPALQKDLNDLIFRVVQQKLGNIDHADNRDVIQDEIKHDRKTILNSDLFKNALLPELKAAYDDGTPYRVVTHYKSENPNTPFDGFIIKGCGK